MIHKLDHRLINLSKKEKKRYNRIVANKFSKYTKKDFKLKKASTGKYWILKDSSEFVSSYQTRIYK